MKTTSREPTEQEITERAIEEMHREIGRLNLRTIAGRELATAIEADISRLSRKLPVTTV
jgi:hypothetical protein